jgi:hypothetical protein
MKSVSSSTLKLLDIEVSSSTLKLDKSDNHRIKTGLMEDGVCGMETGGGGGLQVAVDHHRFKHEHGFRGNLQRTRNVSRGFV